MKKFQQLLLTMFLFSAAFLCIGRTNAKASTTFAEAKIVTISDASEIEKIDAMYTQQCAITSSKDVQEDYFSFTLKKDSWVYLAANYSQFDYDGGQTHISIYSNSSMSNVKAEYGCGYWEYTNDVNDFLSAGTYYVYVRTTLANYSSFNANVNIIGAAIPVDKIFTFSTKVSKKQDSADVTMKCALGSYVKYVQFRPDTKGAEDLNNSSYWKYYIISDYWGGGDDSTQFLDKENGGYTANVTKNGKVTFMIITNSKYTSRYTATYKVSGIDSKKPTVSGVKNGKTYSKAVTIEFSDAGSGIKSAKLNGKKIKSGKTVSEKGSYTLVVTDKAGNKKTVKFKIK